MSEPSQKLVFADESRAPLRFNIVGSETTVKLSGEDTNGAAAFFHLDVPYMSGPPLHCHSLEDEIIYVLEGELIVEIDGTRSKGSANTTFYLPRGLSHSFQNFTSNTVKILVFSLPSGIEHFFEAVDGMTDPALITEVSRKYGIDVTGPPLHEQTI